MILYIEIIIQTFLSFFTILFVTRLIGRQQISQMTFHEYITGITFGSIAADLATDLDGHTMQHFTALILFGLLTGIITIISIKSRSFRKVIIGEPIVIIEKGKILENSLKKARYSIDEIITLLRQKECTTPNDVEYAIIETTGELSVFKKGLKKNVTIEDLNKKPNSDTIPTELIIGGQIIYENLQKKGMDGKKLMVSLKNRGINNISDVMYATIDNKGQFYVDKFQDDLTDSTDMSENSDN